ncbi:site-specific DNA-methyltransferase [Lactococcus lactis]|uniref:site-specific DNA-methyltransferase n=1 Tax=Lactococcus lactis TaxID=1358 RepID=UPI003D0FB693
MSDRPEKINLSDVHSRQVDTDLLNELRELFVKAEEQKERYDFTWNGKAKSYFEAAAPTTKTLRAQPEESVDFEKSENLFITGDNLEALKLLQESYLGKIDMIYIDPPYNTGKDFVYQDNFKKTQKENDVSEGIIDEAGNRLVKNEKSNGRYHSDWLTMMYPRLKLARNLLSDTGAIFVSIDDNEQSNLKLLMDEIFGEDNFVTTFVWEKKKKPSFLNANVGTKFEYILVFAKNREQSLPFSIEKTTAGKKYPFNNAGNTPSELRFPESSITFTKIEDQYIKRQDMSEGNIITSLMNDFEIINGKNKEPVYLYGEWRYSQDTLDELISEDSEITISSIPFRPNLVKKGGEIKKMHNLLTTDKYDIGTNEDATEEFKTLMGGSFFSYTKPTKLIKMLIKSYTYNKKDAIILDFFAGSGTTAESVMQLNKDDSGDRKFILGTLDEDLIKLLETTTDKNKKIVTNAINFLKSNNWPTTPDYIARERIRRAAQKIGDTSGFRALKVDSTGLKEDVFKTAGELDQVDLLKDIDNHSDNRSDYDLLYDVLVDGALEYNRPITIETMNDEQLIKYDYLGELSGVVCYFGENLTDELTRQIATLKPLIAVFKESTFDKSAQKVNVIEQFRIISPDTKVKVI